MILASSSCGDAATVSYKFGTGVRGVGRSAVANEYVAAT